MRQVALFILSFFSLSLHARNTHRELSFDRDPQEEEFDQIAKALVNPMRPGKNRPSSSRGQVGNLGISYSNASMNDRTIETAKLFFDDAKKSQQVTHYHLETVSSDKSGKSQGLMNFTSGIDIARISDTNLTYASITARGGTPILGFRASYGSEVGLSHVAICGYSGELLFQLPIPYIGTPYIGYGVSTMGAAAYTPQMSREISTKWTDRYSIFGMQIDALEYFNTARHLLLSAETQYSTNPRQIIMSAGIALEL